MEGQLTNFIRALRSADVRVSTAEAIDAARALALVGYDDRTMLKTSLDCVLAKSEEEHAIYDRLFDLYFSRSDKTPTSGEAAESEEPDASAAPSETSDGVESGGPQDAPGNDGAPQSLLELANSGDAAAIAMAMEQAAAKAGVDEIRFSTQVSYFTRKMLEAMGVRQLEAELIDRLKDPSESSQVEAQRLMDARASLQETAREHVEQRFDVFGAAATDQFMDDYVARKAMHQLDQRDMERMKKIIARIAKKLAVKYSRRTRKKNRGVLNARKTLRANAGFDGVPFEVHWKQKKKDKPKFVVICDVSSSVAQYVRFLLLLVYSLQDVVPAIRSYAFSYRLKDVSDWLETLGFEAAMQKIVTEVGLGSTDYGQALSDFKVKHWSEIDRRTTIIILGDGRSNYGDPRLDLFREATARAKQTLWLCPEAPGLWGSGDSEILRYKPYCSALNHCKNVRDLEMAVDEVLASYG